MNEQPGQTASRPPSGALGELGPVLVANRGEIAVRVLRSVHALGLRSVAVHTAADRGSPHVAAADRSLLVGSYLDAEGLVAAARRAGARSVHPGYGFLSESAAFARRVTNDGLRWIGPGPEAIELMGNKARSKLLAAEAGVPTVPGTDADPAPGRVAELGFPVIVKALAGGGGKGMRVVRSEAELAGALAAAGREAEAAFGDGRVLAERYFERPRHIEIQVLADAHGAAIHLGERECSLQRRHQKVIEEAPSPVVEPALRERMGEAAVSLARACGYEGAGTVEFIVPADTAAHGEFFFLEMNTRLQVEHPVTELVWDVDLVAEQLRIAAGEPLAVDPAARPAGHAIEARLYAEDPATGFLPATGRALRWREPAGPGVRVDSGLAEGGVIGTDFDPMLAKVIAHGPDRRTAIGRLDRALGELELLGVLHNAAFCRELLARPDVASGAMDTGLVERALPELDLGPGRDLGAAAAAVLYLDDVAGLGVPAGPWRRRIDPLGEVRIEDGELSLDGERLAFGAERVGPGELVVELAGTARRYAYARRGDAVWVGAGGRQLAARIARRERSTEGDAGSLLEAPMPGKVLAIEAANGDVVAAGEVLIVLESMKMELQITAPGAGTVRSLDLAVGDRVGQGQALAAIDPEEEEG